MEETQNYWRKCGSCKKEIGFNSIYQSCSVSTCKKVVFCSVNCWNLHNEVMSHKSAWAEENRSPRKEEAAKETNEERSPKRILVQSKPSSESSVNGPADEQEILIVASKLKAYIKDKYDMNTSANVMEILSYQVRSLTDRAVLKARAEGRKTVMDRDYE